MKNKYNLKALRSLKNWTQAEAGKAVGVSDDVWGRWERGQQFPSVPEIDQIERVFDVCYNDIIFLPNDNGLTVKQKQEV